MTTLSTSGIEQILRTQLLTHSRLSSGETLATLLGATDGGAGLDGKLYIHTVTSDIDRTTPIRWGVMRLQNRRTNAENAEREVAELEVTLFGRPSNQRAALENAADACDEAMLRFDAQQEDGRVGCWGSLRSTMPVFSEPADRDVVQIRCVYSLVIWPAYRTQYSASQ